MDRVVLEKIRNSDTKKFRIAVGMGTCGISSGSREVFEFLKENIKEKKLDIEVFKVGCIGICKYEPILEIYKNNKRITYINVDKEKSEEILTWHLESDEPIKKYLIEENILNIEEDEFLKKQTRIALKNCGNIDCENIDDYIKHDGYLALHKALTSMSKEAIIEEIKSSLLRGRGGAGFYTGTKWELVAKEGSDKKYVCCNADEGDPGAFMDRAILEGNPHSVIEAMIIAAYAVGSDEGYIYVRSEYPTAVKRLNIAIDQAKKLGLLGENILGTDFSFDLSLRLGAGAFVCGEETALINSIEGERGEPRLKPPYPSSSGLFGKPTLINNVETYANICSIINLGSAYFNKFGTVKSKGTKVFALGGKINITGLVEVPIGTTLREIIFSIGGGITDGKEFKAAQTGGPSGGVISREFLDLEMDYESLSQIGSMMGSGGLIVMDEDDCMINMAKFYLDFTVDESCGKCVPCRIGTKRLYEILEKITLGKGELADLEKLENLANHVKSYSLCGLGQAAPNPILSTLKYFNDEYKEHIEEKKCRAKFCVNLLEYQINEDLCVGCGACKRKCPSEAITGNIKEPHEILKDKCIKCGNCFRVCRFKAVNRE